MWSKLSNVLKPRADDNEIGSVLQGPRNASSLSLGPNPDAPVSVPSPPSSPSKQGRRSMFKLMSKTSKGDDSEGVSSPFGLPIGFPRKVKSHLHLNGNSSQASLARGSTDGRPSHDTLRSYQDPMPRASHDSARSPIEGSVRSILRMPKTPGTGQNVRFFSRDAYKVVDPDQSVETEGTPEPMSFADRLQKIPSPASEQPEPRSNPLSGKGVGNRPSITEIFAPATQPTTNDASKNMNSLMMPMPPPDVTNIFDMSQDRALSPIPGGNEIHIPLRDNVTDMTDGDGQAFTSTPYKDSNEKTTYHSMGLSDVAEDTHELSQSPVFAPARPSAREHERTHSFNFGQTVFHSLSRTSASNSEKSRLSDSSSIFSNRVNVITTPDVDFNDESGAEVVVYARSTADQPDPFRMNATTYYTPQTLIPTTPPANSTHSKTTSKEDDVILSLRTQLALQQELCAQYEIDLGARDEIVQTLTVRCEKTEKEGERRRGVLRSWKKKVGELEKACRGLQEEIERGREESWERSVMDEASGEALKCLQRRIETLEREKAEEEKSAEKVMEEKESLVKELAKFKEGLQDAKEHVPSDNGTEGAGECMKALLAKAEHASVAERERHCLAELEWEEERTRLVTRGAQVATDREEFAVELAAAQEQLRQKDNDYGILKSELEAQWRQTESASEQMEEMQKEMEAIREEANGLEKRIGEMAQEWNESESRRTELEEEIQETSNIKESLERQNHELEERLHGEHKTNESLTKALQERDGRVVGLDTDHQLAIDKVSRLEQNIRQRETEIADYSQRVVECEIAAEQLQEQMTHMKREHTCIVNEQAQKLQEMADSDNDARRQIEEMVKAKAEADETLGTLKENVTALNDEVERLRRQVHELQQESADKEVKIVQLTKQRSQDKEDIQGLNIALDSKQQELELLKRKLGVKGTAGSTPANSSKIAQRRDSAAAFTTPGAVRPPSALSDAGNSTRGSDSGASGVKTLTKRVNSSTKSAIGSMGPPPLKHGRSSLDTPPLTNARLTSSLARSSSSKPTTTSATPSINRRASSTALEQARMKMSASGRKVNQSPAPSELGEKENIDMPTPAKVKRRVSVLAPPMTPG